MEYARNAPTCEMILAIRVNGRTINDATPGWSAVTVASNMFRLTVAMVRRP